MMTGPDSQASSDIQTIVVYSANTQGFYHGEIVNQIRQLCELKDYRLIIIQTQDEGEYDLPLHTQNINGVVIIRHAIHSSLAESLFKENIPVVSIAYDYFPLKIPVISIDNEEGVRLAFNYQLERGHSDIVFIGDVSQYDIRKRYEYFCDLLEQANIPVTEDTLISVSDASFNGGYQAADSFINSEHPARAIILGAGLTGIGFIKHLNNLNSELAQSLDLVCFDALSLIPVLSPRMAAVDQNVHLIAYRALNFIEGCWKTDTSSESIYIPPKLIPAAEQGDHEPFIATCVDLANFHNPNYMKAITCNTFEWTDNIIRSELDELMTISPVYESFMGQAFLTRIVKGKSGDLWAKHTKTFNPTRIHDVDKQAKESFTPIGQFPPQSLEKELNSWELCFHFPIKNGKTFWGFLSFYGAGNRTNFPSSYYAFCGTIQSITRQYGHQIQLKALQHQLSRVDKNTSAPPPSESTESAPVSWDLSNNVVYWSDAALNLLNLTSAIEYNIYRNLEFTDRLHHEDVEHFREAISTHKAEKKPFHVQVRLRLKDGAYSPFSLRGKVGDTENKLDLLIQLTEEFQIHSD